MHSGVANQNLAACVVKIDCCRPPSWEGSCCYLNMLYLQACACLLAPYPCLLTVLLFQPHDDYVCAWRAISLGADHG